MRQKGGFMELTDQDLKMLRTHPLFQDMPPELIHQALNAHGGRIADFCDGDRMLSPEETASQAGVVLSGRAEVTTPDETRKVLLRFLGPGDIFGIANLFSAEERSVSTIRASGMCRCVFFTEEAFDRLLEISPLFRKQYIGFLTGRIRFLNRKIGYLTAGSAERRLALYLSSLGKTEIRLNDSITALSDLLNLGRASLYRAFDRLCEDGYLIRNGRNMTVSDPEALRNAYK